MWLIRPPEIFKYLRSHTSVRIVVAGIDEWILGIIGAIIASVVSGIILYLIFKRRTAEKAPRGKAKKEMRKPESKRKTITRVVSVGPGDMKSIVRYIEKGSRITGIAEEVDFYDFNFCIVDDKNYEMLRDEGVPAEDLYVGSDGAIHRFDEKIPHSGDWYFVFDAYGKQLEREIRFRCSVFRKEGS